MDENVRAPNYESAYVDYRNGLKYKEIAEKYGVTINTVKSWKTRYKWSKDGKKSVHTKTKKVCTQKGGQPGNKNAVGHGGTGPPKNKNAVKTGEFETLFFDTLQADEKRLIETVELDKEQLLLQEIQLLTVRERRMLQRIENLKAMEETEPLEKPLYPERKIPRGMSVTKFSDGMEKGEITHLCEYEGILGQIQSIEDALTRVQSRRQKAIESLHKFGYDDAKLEIAAMQLELQIMKQDGGTTETADDGFLTAMENVAADVWGDEDV